MTNKRHVPRIDIQFPIIYRNENDVSTPPDKSTTALLTNLGKTGLRLNSRSSIGPGIIHISGTDDFSGLTITGEVVYSRKTTRPIPEEFDGYETGVRFTDTSEKTLEFITTVVKTAGKTPKPLPKPEHRAPEQEETLNSPLNPELLDEPEQTGRPMDTSRNHATAQTVAEASIKKYKIPFKKSSPATAPVPKLPDDTQSISLQKAAPSSQSRFSTEHTGLVISAFILLAAAIVIVPTPLKNHARFLKEIDIQLPFLTSSEAAMNQQPHAGELILTENSATCCFLQNIHSGPVLVIKGTTPALSQFTQETRKIRGRLVHKTGTIVKEVVVCAGASLSDDQLSSCSPQEINEMLKKQTHLRGPQQTQADHIPYMLVFTDLPETLENLHAEIVIPVL